MVASSVVTTIMILNYHHRQADTHEMPSWVSIFSQRRIYNSFDVVQAIFFAFICKFGLDLLVEKVVICMNKKNCTSLILVFKGIFMEDRLPYRPDESLLLKAHCQ